ncbi:MAG: hypothetical protein PHV82_05980 [Victivallaceae bacterium]|nr:hypothetical protein [Victivallaceae bacterium]
MTIQTLTAFFMWCTIINAALLVISSLIVLLMADWIYNFHSRLFAIPREAFDIIIYSFLGFFKIMIFIFNLVPWIALSIIGS